MLSSHSQEYEVPKNPALCKFRWGYHIVNFGQQAVRHCCRTPLKRMSDEEVREFKQSIFSNHPFHRERREEMLKGIRHQECQSCWTLEDAGMQSPRERFNSLEEIDSLAGNQSRLESERSLARKPWMIDIELSNKCDMACMYCNRFFSSKWASEDIKFNRVSEEQVKAESRGASREFEEAFWNWFSSVKYDLKYINFIGGEPFLNQKYFDSIERIIREFDNQPRRRLVLATVSNFNAPEKTFDKVLPLITKLSQLYNVYIDASQESFGKKAEFIRYGLSWETWLKNVNKVLSYKLENFEFGIQSAINILSLKNLAQFFEAITDIRDHHETFISLKVNTVLSPTYHSPLIASEDFVDDIKKAATFIRSHSRPELTSKMNGHIYYGWNQYADFLENLAKSILEKQSDTAYLKSERAKFYSWCEEYQQTRGLNFLETFPEYAEFYEICKKAAI